MKPDLRVWLFQYKKHPARKCGLDVYLILHVDVLAKNQREAF